MTHCELITRLYLMTVELYKKARGKEKEYFKGKLDAYEELLQILKGDAAVPAMKRD